VKGEAALGDGWLRVGQSESAAGEGRLAFGKGGFADRRGDDDAGVMSPQIIY
jgi:hypothetical protein